MIRHQIVN